MAGALEELADPVGAGEGRGHIGGDAVQGGLPLNGELSETFPYQWTLEKAGALLEAPLIDH